MTAEPITVPEIHYDSHPSACLFPIIEGDAFDELVEDIKAHGLLHPIVIHNGMILDGRNRFNACKVAGVKPRFVIWEPRGTTPTEWVLATNLKRRHLSASERAAIAVNALPPLQAEAKEKQREAARRRKEIGDKITEEFKDGISMRDVYDPQPYRTSLTYAEQREYHKLGMRAVRRVYFIFSPAGSKIKIGVSSNLPERITEFKKHVPDLVLLGDVPGDEQLERLLHADFAEHALGNEWFNDCTEIRKHIVDLVSLCNRANSEEDKRPAVHAHVLAAKLAGVGSRYVSDAKKIKEQSPEVFAEVAAGNKTIQEAKREIAAKVNPPVTVTPATETEPKPAEPTEPPANREAYQSHMRSVNGLTEDILNGGYTRTQLNWFANEFKIASKKFEAAARKI